MKMEGRICKNLVISHKKARKKRNERSFQRNLFFDKAINDSRVILQASAVLAPEWS